MNKTPFPSPDGVPPCFGVQYDERDFGCKRCPVVAQCVPRSEEWANRQSLSERLAQFDAQLAAPLNETTEEIYDRLHREIFGRRSTRRDTEANALLFARMHAMCLREDIDPATYIAGNMWAMKPWVEKNRRIGFQPNHLSGEKATRRYFAYFGRQKRRFRQQRHTGETSGTLHADIRQNLVIGEYAVGLEFVRAFIADGGADWNAAMDEAEPNKDWLAVERDLTGRRAHELRAIFGRGRLQEEKLRAELRAACDVAEQYEHDLAHRIGVGHSFDWQSLAELLARLYPVPEDTLSPVVGVTGAEWHGRG